MALNIDLAYNTQEKAMADAVEQKFQEISSDFKERIVSYTCSNGITMDAGMLDILQFERGLGLVISGGGAEIEVTDVTNSVHLVTAQAAEGMITELIANYVTLFGRKTALRKLVNAATTIAEIQAINWDTRLD